jgi:type I restriction enzyme S subunit
MSAILKQQNKLTPELRFQGYSSEWEKMHLKDLFLFKNGVNASKEQYGQGYKFINVLDIMEDDFITHDTIRGSVNISENEFNKNIVSYGDVLFQRSSETREEVGQANVYLDKSKSATFGGFVIRGQKNSEYDPVFMNYLLKVPSVRKDITSRSGGSTRYNIGQDSLEKVSVLIPTLAEQQKIGNFLETVDVWIKNLSARKVSLKKYKVGVMRKIFNQEVRFKNEIGKDFPEWEEKMISEISSKSNTGLSANTLNENNGDYMVYGAAGKLKKIDFFQEEDPYLAIVKDGAGVGRVFICEPKTSVLSTLNVIRPKGDVDLYFLHCLVANLNLKKYIIGGTIPHIYYKDYKKELVRIPCLEEQNKISDYLTSIDNLINSMQDQIDKAKQWKKGLMQQLFV